MVGVRPIVLDMALLIRPCMSRTDPFRPTDPFHPALPSAMSSSRYLCPLKLLWQRACDRWYHDKDNPFPPGGFAEGRWINSLIGPFAYLAFLNLIYDQGIEVEEISRGLNPMKLFRIQSKTSWSGSVTGGDQGRLVKAVRGEADLLPSRGSYN
ncbi:unnamed protein product [Nezara viridula]|uniref:Uncharacterized protein n=1 Tax=Nezara viridula TaxID=85310 RepID=A0A9P0H6N4_NEZVI|nr:unnamed protein product [Nezara viridula]